MARITGPSDITIPGVSIQDIPVLVPVDLPEGGFLQVVVGASALQPPAFVIQLPRGCMLGMVPPATVEAWLPNLKTDPRVGAATVVQLPDAQIYDVFPFLSPVWLPTGGYLQVVIGENPAAMPIPSTPVEAGSLLGIIPPEAADQLRDGLNLQAKMNPYAIVPGGLVQ